MRIDLGISAIGVKSAKDTYYVNITRKDVIKRVTEHPSIDPWTKDYLVKKINEYPDNALIYFVQNINKIVINALNERMRFFKERQNEAGKSEAVSAEELRVEESGEGSGDVGGAKDIFCAPGRNNG